MPRGKVTSEDLAWVVVRLSALFSIDDVSLFTRISTRQIQRIIGRWAKTGDVVPEERRKRLGRRRKLTLDDVLFIIQCIADSCDVYLDEIQRQLHVIRDVSVSQSTIWRSLRRAGFSLKKVTRIALERSARKRAEYMFKVGRDFEPKQLVFVDESACDKRTTYRGQAWSICGQRAIRKTFFVRGKRFSVLPALSMSGILHVEIVEGSFDGKGFKEFVEVLLTRMNPFPGENSVIVMDNCAIHKSEDVRDMIEDRGMRYQFLPPYSPDFNPIELSFAYIKAGIKRDGYRFRAAAEDRDTLPMKLALSDAVWSITPELSEGWYRHCGYATHL